jgi:RNA polymerase sigma-70 factor (ECF subfamily)
LVCIYAPLVALWCRRWRVAEQDIPDVLQEVFAAVSRNLGRFRKERPSDRFRAWLLTIARNKVNDFYRHRAEEPRGAGGTEATARLAQHPAMASIQLEEAIDENVAFGEVLQRALASIRLEFHEQTWLAFWRVVVDGRAASDVAAELKMQPGAVRVCKSRVLSRLRRALEVDGQ